MSRSLQTRPPRFPQRAWGSCAGAAGSRRHGRRSDRPDSAPLLRDLHRQRHVAAEDRSTASTSGAGSRPPERNGEFVFGKSTEPLAPFRKQLSFMGGLYHPNGPKADPHVCSDMWLTGAPLHNPKPGTYNSVGLDQVVALHTKQYCRQPSLVLSIDAGTGFLSRTGTISYNLEGRPIPAENNPRRVFDRLFRGDRTSLKAEHEKLQRRIKLVDAVAESARSLDQQLGKTDRERMDQYLTSLNEVESRLIASEKLDRHPAEEAGLLAPESRRDQRGRAGRVLPQHVRPDRAGVRCRHHALGRVHAQPRRRHGHQRHVPAQAGTLEDAPQSLARHRQGRAAGVREVRPVPEPADRALPRAAERATRTATAACSTTPSCCSAAARARRTTPTTCRR